ncbi:M48 family metallopeptidase [Paraburkholderia sp. ZP32-5]|uniref:M48 family metallopeptidase n=1 Tax=Paraburkholderia sp. ZP32-5 TaxID=2883245 RepID=UPI001F1F932B|nr:M48 family metallopeptidase [Paraburkholderia sp. ZP32-5]
MVAHSEDGAASSAPRGTRYYDGRNAVAHEATLRWSDAFLSILPIGDETAELAVWPRERLTVSEPDPDGQVVMSCKGQPGRLMTDARTLPQQMAARRMRGRHYLGWTAVGVATLAIGVALVVGLPSVGAALVPRSAEARLGDMVETLVVGRHRVCSGADGQHALEQLEARLAQAAKIDEPVRLVVIDSKIVNAVTLPGGRVIIMRGLLDHVNNADQLAGVMAHETGHIARRDPLVSLFRRAGIRAVGATLGFNVGLADASSLAGQLVGLSYSREMERLADANGVAYLQASGLRSDGLAAFFASMEKSADKKSGGTSSSVLEFFSDHPRTVDREKLNRGSSLGDSALTPSQWAAVRAMCGKP